MNRSVRPGRAAQMVRMAQYGFTILGLAALGYCLAVWLNTRSFQSKQERSFKNELHHRQTVPRPIPSPKKEAPPMPRDGAVLARLDIPRIGVDVMVVEGDNGRDLRVAAGHIPGTALPGQAGNVAIAAHRDTFFRPLRNIRKDDTITLKTPGGIYHYRVVSTSIVKPDDVAVLRPTRGDSLTLVTCFPFYYIGSAPDRFIVRANRAG